MIPINPIFIRRCASTYHFSLSNSPEGLGHERLEAQAPPYCPLFSYPPARISSDKLLQLNGNMRTQSGSNFSSSLTLQHSLLYHLFLPKLIHNLQNEHHAVLKNTQNVLADDILYTLRSRNIFIWVCLLKSNQVANTYFLIQASSLKRFLINYPGCVQA